VKIAVRQPPWGRFLPFVRTSRGLPIRALGLDQGTPVCQRGIDDLSVIGTYLGRGADLKDGSIALVYLPLTIQEETEPQPNAVKDIWHEIEPCCKNPITRYCSLSGTEASVRGRTASFAVASLTQLLPNLMTALILDPCTALSSQISESSRTLRSLVRESPSETHSRLIIDIMIASHSSSAVTTGGQARQKNN
jgi:hypothetical protein